MKPLTRAQAQERAAQVTVSAMTVTVDLSCAENGRAATFPVRSELEIVTASPQVIVDVAGRVEQVLIDGAPARYAHVGDSLHIDAVPTSVPTRIVVAARCAYSTTGEGLHRFVDPEDSRTYLYTQFEPNDAHRAWPCFDQPDMKAPWTFHVIARASWVVVSNGRCESTTALPGGLTRHDFATTEPLSSYLTAVVAGPYAVIDGGVWRGEGGPEDGIELRALCRAALAPHMDSDDIFEVTRQGLDFFHSHYQFAYPWGKYDQIFVPEYNLGAMENPGCVTFTEDYLSRNGTTIAQRQRRANTILHEMSHMWFGDLVTPAWWDDLWLKESFADHQGTFAAAAATQYQGEWASFAVARKAWAYLQDQLPTTHPIVATIDDVADAKNNFDGITYAKGAAVIKQLVAWVGEDAFFEATRRYFQRYAFAVASRADFMEIVAQTSGMDLTHWTDVWLNTAGPSRLRVDKVVDADGRITTFDLVQEAAATSPGVLRPHFLTVSTWALRDERLVRTHSFEVRAVGERTPIDLDDVLDRPGAAEDAPFVVINDEDLTYAVCRMDVQSQEIALKYVHTVPDAVTRAVVWSSLWNAVRDGALPATTFAHAVITQAQRETEPAIVRHLLNCAAIAVERYMDQQTRTNTADDLVYRLFYLLCVKDNLDEYPIETFKDWVEFYLRLSQQQTTRALYQNSPVYSLVQFQHINSHLTLEKNRDHPLAGEVDPELVWKARVTLATHGLYPRESVEMDAERSPEAEYAKYVREALAGAPHTENNNVYQWALATSGELSNEMLTATLSGIWKSRKASKADTELFFTAVEDFWMRNTIGIGIRFIRAGFPKNPDFCSPERAQQWLDDHPHAPAALRRLMLEETDELARSARLRQVS